MKNRIKKYAVATLLTVFTFASVLPAMAGNTDQIDALNNRQDQLDQNIKETQQKLNNTILEKNKLLSDLEALNRSVNKVENDIETLTKEIDVAVVKIDATAVEIDNKQRDFDGRMMIFSQRLKEIYQYGDVSFLEVLLQSSDLTDFLSRFEYLQYIAQNDKDLLEDVIEIKNALETQKASLETQKTSLETKRKTQEEKSKELEIASAQKEDLVQQVKAEENNIYVMLDAFEEESNRIAQQILRLQSSGGTAPSTSEFGWPCPSSKRVTSAYGSRIHPVKKTKSFHTGVDIGASHGKEIVAAATGTVIVAAFNSAYGNYIIVDHGGGVSTMYAHMSAFVSGVGDVVVTGQPIGKIGSTGLSTGPHLHFEVRIDGKHVSPNKYIGI